MHRTLPNILFLLILFLLATAFPLSTDILSLNLSTKIVEKPVEDIIIEAKLDPVLPIEQDSITKDTLTFEIKSSTGSFPSDLLTDYEILIHQNDRRINSIKLSDLSPNITDGSESSKSVSLSKVDLLEALPEGYYTFNISHKGNMLDYKWFGGNMIYDKTMLATQRSIAASQLGFTLFYPTKDYSNVVPITRIVSLPDNRWRALYTALTNGPKAELGLTDKVPAVPFAPNIRISQNVANIYMYSANLSGYEEFFPTVLDSITKTFMSLGPLNGVKFFVNDSDKAFSGSDLAATYTQVADSSAYIGYSNNSAHMMLLPVKLTSSDFDVRVDEIWKTLKMKNPDVQQIEGVIQTIPDEVEIESFALEGQTLTIDLNVSPTSLFENASEYEDLMLNAILYSYVSLPEVDAIRLTVLGQTFSNQKYDFSAAVIPDKFINMEP